MEHTIVILMLHAQTISDPTFVIAIEDFLATAPSALISTNVSQANVTQTQLASTPMARLLVFADQDTWVMVLTVLISMNAPLILVT